MQKRAWRATIRRLCLAAAMVAAGRTVDGAQLEGIAGLGSKAALPVPVAGKGVIVAPTAERPLLLVVTADILPDWNIYSITQPDGGQVRVEATGIFNGFARISVSDTGVGIPEADLMHVFERFYRVDKSRSRERGGSGLGLSIAQKIVEAHKGRITVSSKVGEGTTFDVYIPIVGEAHAAPEPTARNHSATHPGRRVVPGAGR